MFNIANTANNKMQMHFHTFTFVVYHQFAILENIID